MSLLARRSLLANANNSVHESLFLQRLHSALKGDLRLVSTKDEFILSDVDIMKVFDATTSSVHSRKKCTVLECLLDNWMELNGYFRLEFGVPNFEDRWIHKMSLFYLFFFWIWIKSNKVLNLFFYFGMIWTYLMNKERIVWELNIEEAGLSAIE